MVSVSLIGEGPDRSSREGCSIRADGEAHPPGVGDETGLTQQVAHGAIQRADAVERLHHRTVPSRRRSFARQRPLSRGRQSAQGARQHLPLRRVGDEYLEAVRGVEHWSAINEDDARAAASLRRTPCLLALDPDLTDACG